jgi:phosphoribosylformylglycinamidine synthase
MGITLKDVRILSSYLIQLDCDSEAFSRMARETFYDPVAQEIAIDHPLRLDADFWVEVGFKPGVTDNVGKTARQVISDYFGRTLKARENVFTASTFLLYGGLDRDTAERIARRILGNPLIHRFIIFGRGEFEENIAALRLLPVVKLEAKGEILRFDLDLPPDDLVRLSRERVLALNLREMEAIRDEMKRPEVIEKRGQFGLDHRVTDVELEAIAQTWSEHCKHKIFNATIHYREGGKFETIRSLFKTYIQGTTEKVRARKKERDICVSVFTDNAGVIRFDDETNLVFKVETHNSPSALDPYGGALTGIVGVNRDPFGTGLGAQLTANTDVFCFADPWYDKPIPEGILHPRKIYEGVREGVEHGGNKSGIPTVNGAVVFEERFLGRPLVFCGTCGIMPAEINGRSSHVKWIDPGDRIVMVGGRIGADGIHGATFSSEKLSESSPVTAVQIGDPITQKKMFDFLIKARDMGLYHAITDNGAGGLSSSVGEMAQLSGGAEMALEKAPLKYPGLRPWEILVSEAQERMTVAVPPENMEAFMALSEKMGVESTDLGQFTDSGYFHVTFEGETVAYLDMEFFHNGLPSMELEAEWTPPGFEVKKKPVGKDLKETLLSLMGTLNVCSKESIIRQYDHEVQGGSVIKPLTGEVNDGPSDAAVLRPRLDSMDGMVLANGICPKYSDYDAYWMAACAVDEAVRNAICVGCDPDHMAALDNFCWCDPIASPSNPDGKHKLAQLVRANRALYDVLPIYGIPLISGKDSMKNDVVVQGRKISIPPTLLVSIIGKIQDVRRAVSMDFKRPGDLLYLLGMTYPELAGSEYYTSSGFRGGRVPKVDPEIAWKRYQSVHKAMGANLIRSCHDCSDGGIGVALVEKALAGGLGAEIDCSKIPEKECEGWDEVLFSESQSRLVVTVSPDDRDAFERIFKGDNMACIGAVREDKKIIFMDGAQRLFTVSCDESKQAWQKPLNF